MYIMYLTHENIPVSFCYNFMMSTCHLLCKYTVRKVNEYVLHKYYFIKQLVQIIFDLYSRAIATIGAWGVKAPHQ